MRILEVHIDGFGIFANKHLTGLTSGINVIYGLNECGKTTFLEFVRRILFGFPRSSASTNPYPPLQGGAYGGKLICKLRSGEDVTIARTEPPRGGRVNVLLGSRELAGQEALNDVLGHITRSFYENVYGISLNELQALKTLEGEEVRSHIYGAGLGLGSISLSDIKSELKKSCESLYKPRGSAQKMPRLHDEIIEIQRDIREIQKGLSDYDGLWKRREEIIDETVRLDEYIRNLKVTQRSLENKQKLYPTYLNLVNAQSELSGLEELADFPEDAKDNVDNLDRDIAHLDSQMEQAQQELKVLQLKMDGLVYNKNILDKEPTVISLHRSSEEYKSALRDIDGVKIQRNSKAQAIKKDIIKLGQRWSDTFIRDFELNHPQKGKIHSYKKDLDEAKRKLGSAKDKLEVHKEGRAVQVPQRFTGPNFYRYAIYAVTVLGLIGTIGGLLSSQWSLVTFSALLLGIGVFVLLKIGKWDQIKSIDTLENTLKARLDQAESEHERLRKDWRTFLRGINFDENLTPEGALEVAKTVQDIQSHLSELEDFDRRIDQMKSTIDKMMGLHNQLSPYVKKSQLSDDISANIEIIAQHLNNAKETKKDKENIEGQIKGLTTEIETLQKKKEAKERQKQDYTSSLGAADEHDLRRKHNVFTQRKDLSAKMDESRGIIQLTVGADKHYDGFIESISSDTPEQIESELEEANAQIEGLQTDLAQKNQTIGELGNKLEQLSSSQDLLVKQSEYELKRQQLLDYSREWVKWRIAEVMLNRATSKYENTRQPEVIRAASSIFSNITNHKYPTVKKLAESDEIRIIDEYGNTKDLLQLSRGTQEELYFAMRLGLIKEYESRSESMPIIMDDILVNFDDERGPLAIEALNDFAKDRQIIVLTCHKAALDIYKKHGANEISLT